MVAGKEKKKFSLKVKIEFLVNVTQVRNQIFFKKLVYTFVDRVIIKSVVLIASL